MGFCSCSSKFVIIVINIFFLLGAALLIFSGVNYMTAADDAFQDVPDKTYHRPAYILFGIAAFLILSGIVGTIGAFSEKKVLLGLFATVVFITFGLTVAATALLFMNQDAAKNATDVFALKQFNNYGNPNLTVALAASDLGFDAAATTPAAVAMVTTMGSGFGTTAVAAKNTTTANTTTQAPTTTTAHTTTLAPTTTTAHTTIMPPVTTAVPSVPKGDFNATEFIDSIQEHLECCGWNNYTEWDTYDYWTGQLKNKGMVPNSCCNHTAAAAKNATCLGVLDMKKHQDLIYTNACRVKVDKAVHYVYMFSSYTALAFTILVFLGFVSAIYLMCRKRSSDGFNYSSIVA